MSLRSAQPADLPAWAWLWFPPVMLLAELGTRLYDEPLYRQVWDSELGPLENGTVVVLLPGIVAGLLALRYRSLLPAPWLSGWILLFVLGSIYLGGEEASWGQHWFGWQTPEGVQALNDQQETNLHNMSSWLDQKPRFLLEMWVLFAGIVYPLWQRRVGGRPMPDRWSYWILPSPIVLPTALLAILIKLPERFNDWFGIEPPPPLDIRLSETQEYYFALFLCLYLCSIYVRLRHRALGG